MRAPRIERCIVLHASQEPMSSKEGEQPIDGPPPPPCHSSVLWDVNVYKDLRIPLQNIR